MDCNGIEVDIVDLSSSTRQVLAYPANTCLAYNTFLIGQSFQITCNGNSAEMIVYSTSINCTGPSAGSSFSAYFPASDYNLTETSTCDMSDCPLVSTKIYANTDCSENVLTSRYVEDYCYVTSTSSSASSFRTTCNGSHVETLQYSNSDCSSSATSSLGSYAEGV